MILFAIISFVAILGVLVFVHELGHFIVAKLCGVRVEEFGFGYPPRLWGVKRGETTYSLNWIPIGGFVKIHGVLGGDQMDMTGKTDAERSFTAKPRWQRLIILCAGIVMNCILGIVLFTVSYQIGAPVILEDLPKGAIISQQAITVVDLESSSAAYAAGVRVNDSIIAVDQQPIQSVEEMRTYLLGKDVGETVGLTLKRDQETVTIQTELIALSTTPSAVGIGAYFIETGIMRLPIHLAVREGVRQTGRLFVGIIVAVGQVLTNLFTQRPIEGQISGPLGIASLTYEATQLGSSYVIQFAAMLSVNLAVFNLLPIPALDGGRIMFLLLEWIRRRPVDAKIEALIHNIGFVALLILIMVVTIQDFTRFF